MNNNRKGSITLETILVLPIFFFMFLFIDGLFVVVTAHNTVTHALIQSSKSLSLDSYITENSGTVFKDDTITWGGVSEMIIDLIRINNNPNFTSHTNWYSKDSVSSSIIKARFVGYLSGGDEDDAESKLKALGVVDGLNGIKLNGAVNGEELTITANYTIQFWFDFMDMGKIPLSQQVTCRLWK